MARRSGFISYSRMNEECASEIEGDLASLGVDAWRDRQLSGGQDWWDTVLSSIESADVVAFLISDTSLESVPCSRELEYAAALNKQILPIRIDMTIEPRRAPPLLASLEWIDYEPADKSSYLRLRAALERLPASPLPPEPAPERPTVPLSYTTNLRAMAHRDTALTGDEQFSLFKQLEHGMATPQDRDECLAILRIMRGRRELLATVAADIDAVFASTAATDAAAEAKAQPGPATSGGSSSSSPPGVSGASGGPSPTTGPPPEAAPPPRRRRVWPILIGVLAVVGALTVGGIVIAGLVGSISPQGPGGDPTLDALFAQCQDGDAAACDDLYFSAGVGTEYEEFGATCGGVLPADGGTCEERAAVLPPPTGVDLDSLWDECAAGILSSCDSLYLEADIGSDYESFGYTCGNREAETWGSCAG